MPVNSISSGRSGDINEVTLDATSATQSEWIQATYKLIVQVTGAATAVSIDIERSTINPVMAAANPAKVATITGNPATGITPSIYEEPGAGWWRAKLTSITGTPVHISIQAPEA